MKRKTFEQFMGANPYKETRSFTKEDWESSMYEKWKDESKEVKEGGELFTGGEWFVDSGDFDRLQDAGEILVRSEASEDGDRERFDICNFGCDETGKAKANALLIAQSKNMYYALKAIVDNWDQHMIGDKEQLKKNIEHDIEYWSPSASMINSEHIANAREILLKATPKK